MKPTRNPLSDVTRSSMNDLAEGVQINSLNTKGNRSVIASGDIRAIPVRDGLMVMIGYLKGQNAYNAQGYGLPGLSVEIRLDGYSSAIRADQTGAKSELRPGEYRLLACRKAVEWDISAPEQALFRTVSLNLSKEFVDSIGDKKLSAFNDELLGSEAAFGGAAPAGILAMAEQLFMLGKDDLLSAARAHWLSLGIVTETCAAALAQKGDAAGSVDSVYLYARRYVCQNVGADVTIEQVAKHCRISPATLKAVFAENEGKSLGAFMREQRMIAAQHMLDQGVPIASVAQTLRYSAPEAFSRAFRHHFGYAPSLNARKKI